MTILILDECALDDINICKTKVPGFLLPSFIYSIWFLCKSNLALISLNEKIALPLRQ